MVPVIVVLSHPSLSFLARGAIAFDLSEPRPLAPAPNPLVTMITVCRVVVIDKRD